MTQTTADADFLRRAALSAKPNKAQAAEIIRSIAGANAQDNELRNALATLYTYFLPPAPKKAAHKDVWAWVCQAINPKDARPYLHYVMADGMSIWATDGHRMHSARDLREPGLYDPKTGALVWGLEGVKGDGHPGRFPDVKRILPERDQGASRAVSAATVAPVSEGLGGYVRARVGFGPQAAFDVNLPYWREATEALDDGATLQIPARDMAPARIDGYHKATGAEVLAVIMPMRP